MKTLTDAYAWYEATKTRLQNMRRLATKYWDELPWQGALGRDDHFRGLAATEVDESVTAALKPLDDLTILVLFSVFEEVVRDRVIGQVQPAMDLLRTQHPVLRVAGEELLDNLKQGSIFRVLESLKTPDDSLTEQVNQVRVYRNWIAHGKREDGKERAAVTPRQAFDRLNLFLSRLETFSFRSTPS